ncbi:TraR/DksA family transcriptional regulator [Pseudomonas sp. LRF_L74]|uniref:TraR/DksA family transcriptional regulator n=1 Tax=Pseudomonas sp. LRF_L74 TaxID=3369422 RepID=UPI003F60AD00
MADLLDLASEREENLRQGALRLRQTTPAYTLSAEFCEDCGGPIPGARRVAVPGCQTCIDCQQLREARG